MKKDDYLLVGKLLRPHGIRGLILIHSYATSLNTFLEAGLVYLEIDGCMIPFEVSHVAPHKKNLLMRLAGLETRESIEPYRGCNIFIKKDTLTRNEDEYFWFELLGMDVFLESGEYIGRLTRIIPTGANDIYIVSNRDKEVYIPATVEVVREIDVAQKRMIVTDEQGIVGLNEI